MLKQFSRSLSFDPEKVSYIRRVDNNVVITLTDGKSIVLSAEEYTVEELTEFVNDCLAS